MKDKLEPCSSSNCLLQSYIFTAQFYTCKSPKPAVHPILPGLKRKREDSVADCGLGKRPLYMGGGGGEGTVTMRRTSRGEVLVVGSGEGFKERRNTIAMGDVTRYSSLCSACLVLRLSFEC